MKGKYYPYPPSKIQLGYQDISVSMVDWLDGDGCYSPDRHEIRIKEGAGNRELLNTMLHEIIHAAIFCYGLKKDFKDEDHEEHVVNALANGLTEVLVRNPRLVKWVNLAVKS